jgi:serine/threonine protein kinase
VSDPGDSSYRAPELLFGAEDYDPFSTDMWSLGCTLAEFFTSVQMQRNDDGDTSDEDVSVGLRTHVRASHIVPAGEEASLNRRWRRDSLFDASRGEIGLAWSIFQTRGTPTETSWPV